MNNHVLIVAEAGVNHNGSLELAMQMAKVAKECGADIVKYQTAIPELVISVYAPKAEYQKETTGDASSQLEMCKQLHFDFEGHRKLKEYCDSIRIEYMSTPFDIPSVKFLGTLGCRYIKVPSGEITNYPYLVEVGKLRQDIILSTGMSTIDEIRAAMDILKENGCGNISVLHCNTEYPTPYRDVNLSAMYDIRDSLGVEYGLSDHSNGWECDVAAAVMGAAIIEKHFTLDRNMEGPDHKASLEPQELKAMVDAIRHVEEAMGSGIKEVSESERKNMDIARKSIIAARHIAKGEILSEENLTTKRPGNGINPMRWNEVLGTAAVRDFEPDELIEL